MTIYFSKCCDLAGVINPRTLIGVTSLFLLIDRLQNMGKHNSKLAPEVLDDLTKNTEFNETELKQWYKGFLKDCPSGILNLEEFQQLYVKVSPFAQTAPRNYDCDFSH